MNQPLKLDTKGMNQNVAKMLEGLTQTLNEPVIQIRKLRAFLSEGIPDEAAVIRQYAWKVVLGYLPRNKQKWNDQITKQQHIYQQFIRQYLPDQKYEDYPLLMGKGHPLWKQYQKDYYIWQQIEKDTCRTQSQLSFFSAEAPPIMIPFLNSARKEKYKMIHGEDQSILQLWLSNKEEQRRTYRYDYMTRILFIYAKLNPRAQYVQGMNEVLAPIFYLVNSPPKKQRIDQAACFFMFNNVMTDLIELNIQAFDKKQNGIHGRMEEINKILLATQPKIWHRMESLKIDPIFYCFRWLTLLFAQQFQLFQILRIWESIFSYQDRAVFVNFFAVQLIISCKNVIMSSQYGQILSHLKHIRQHINIREVIMHASELYHEHKGMDIVKQAQKNYQKLNKDKKERGSRAKLINYFKKFI